jgi:hypothetical protein
MLKLKIYLGLFKSQNDKITVIEKLQSRIKIDRTSKDYLNNLSFYQERFKNEENK